jgi:hypothetical protein
LLVAFDDWEKDFRRLMNDSVPTDASPRERFESTWARLIETFETHRSLWVANMELFSQIPRMPEIRGALGNNLQLARSELASLFLNKEQRAISERATQTIGKFHHVLLSGLIMQWLIDPEHGLSARDLTEALLSTAEGLQTTRKAPKSKPGTRSRRRS